MDQELHIFSSEVLAPLDHEKSTYSQRSEAFGDFYGGMLSEILDHDKTPQEKLETIDRMASGSRTSKIWWKRIRQEMNATARSWEEFCQVNGWQDQLFGFMPGYEDLTPESLAEITQSAQFEQIVPGMMVIIFSLDESRHHSFPFGDSGGFATSMEFHGVQLPVAVVPAHDKLTLEHEVHHLLWSIADQAELLPTSGDASSPHRNELIAYLLSNDADTFSRRDVMFSTHPDPKREPDSKTINRVVRVALSLVELIRKDRSLLYYTLIRTADQEQMVEGMCHLFTDVIITPDTDIGWQDFWQAFVQLSSLNESDETVFRKNLMTRAWSMDDEPRKIVTNLRRNSGWHIDEASAQRITSDLRSKMESGNYSDDVKAQLATFIEVMFG